ncbi:MFP1 attachment factor 1-like [Alnus glutinosa]|uniref:MFP1 attachment factor 1-like n=1 Tax=Alnus glutinosa TaxID=3517 RepID=UPI002D7661C3|nr:MFP1 attachment factor 1-like [Alnus glutinosa]
MAEVEEAKRHEINATKAENTNVSFTIWLPSQGVRDAVIVRLTKTLSSSSSSSVISNSKHYGSVPADEASAAARVIEEEAFSAASAADDDVDRRIETLGVYAKEISKRTLEMLKVRAAQVFVR